MGNNGHNGRVDPAAIAARNPGAYRAAALIHGLRQQGVPITPVLLKALIAHFDRVEKDQPVTEVGNALSHEPLVFYARTGDRVTIGQTTNLRTRLNHLRPDEVLAVEPGDARKLRQRQMQFARLHEADHYRYEDTLITWTDTLRRRAAGLEAGNEKTQAVPLHDYTAEEIAAMHGVTRNHVYMLAARHKWPRVKGNGPTRYDAEEVEKTFGVSAA